MGQKLTANRADGALTPLPAPGRNEADIEHIKAMTLRLISMLWQMTANNFLQGQPFLQKRALFLGLCPCPERMKLMMLPRLFSMLWQRQKTTTTGPASSESLEESSAPMLLRVLGCIKGNYRSLGYIGLL